MTKRRIANFLLVVFVAFLTYVALFLIVHFANLNNLTLQSEDYLGSATLPFSILREGNVDLNEYHETLINNYPHPDDPTFTPYYIKEDAGKYYTIRPILTPLLALPVYVPYAFFSPDISIDDIRFMSRIGGAFITALAVGLAPAPCP